MRKENEIKNVKKVERNVFTNGESNNIIRKDYDPLTVNKKYLQRKGMFMEGKKDVLLNEEMEKLIISKEDFRKYFNERKIICKNEYEEYLKQKK